MRFYNILTTTRKRTFYSNISICVVGEQQANACAKFKFYCYSINLHNVNKTSATHDS
jgi:hypothetical protein